MIKRIVGLLYHLLWDVIKEVLIKAALIVLRLCHRWVCTSWVDSTADKAADIVDLFDLNLERGRKKICIETKKYICVCTINSVIDVSCIAFMLCSISWTKLWQYHQLACYPGRQTMVDLGLGEGNPCPVDFINQWSIFHAHLSYAIEVCPVNKILNVCSCKSKHALLNCSSRQQINKKGTLNLPHQH